MESREKRLWPVTQKLEGSQWRRAIKTGLGSSGESWERRDLRVCEHLLCIKCVLPVTFFESLRKPVGSLNHFTDQKVKAQWRYLIFPRAINCIQSETP